MVEETNSALKKARKEVTYLKNELEDKKKKARN
jgi:hypothetical protein